MAKLLLEKGATINAFDKKDRRAVHWAAYMGHTEVVRILVEHGAELNCRDKQVRSSQFCEFLENIFKYVLVYIIQFTVLLLTYLLLIFYTLSFCEQSEMLFLMFPCVI